MGQDQASAPASQIIVQVGSVHDKNRQPFCVAPNTINTIIELAEGPYSSVAMIPSRSLIQRRRRATEGGFHPQDWKLVAT